MKLLKLWDVKTGRRRVLHNHDGTVWAITASPDGQMIAITDGLIKVWNLNKNEYVPLCQQLDWTTSVRFSPDGQIVAGACNMERLNCGTSKQGNVSTLYPDINGCPCCS